MAGSIFSRSDVISSQIVKLERRLGDHTAETLSKARTLMTGHLEEMNQQDRARYFRLFKRGVDYKPRATVQELSRFFSENTKWHLRHLSRADYRDCLAVIEKLPGHGLHESAIIVAERLCAKIPQDYADIRADMIDVIVRGRYSAPLTFAGAAQRILGNNIYAPQQDKARLIAGFADILTRLPGETERILKKVLTRNHDPGPAEAKALKKLFRLGYTDQPYRDHSGVILSVTKAVLSGKIAALPSVRGLVCDVLEEQAPRHGIPVYCCVAELVEAGSYSSAEEQSRLERLEETLFRQEHAFIAGNIKAVLASENVRTLDTIKAVRQIVRMDKAHMAQAPVLAGGALFYKAADMQPAVRRHMLRIIEGAAGEMPNVSFRIANTLLFRAHDLSPAEQARLQNFMHDLLSHRDDNVKQCVRAEMKDIVAHNVGIADSALMAKFIRAAGGIEQIYDLSPPRPPESRKPQNKPGP